MSGWERTLHKLMDAFEEFDDSEKLDELFAEARKELPHLEEVVVALADVWAEAIMPSLLKAWNGGPEAVREWLRAQLAAFYLRGMLTERVMRSA